MKKLTLIFITLALSIGQTIAQDYKTIAVACYSNNVGILQQIITEFKPGLVQITKDNISFTMFGATASHKIAKVEVFGSKTKIYTEEGHKVTISTNAKTIQVDKTTTNDGLYQYTYIYQIK